MRPRSSSGFLTQARASYGGGVGWRSPTATTIRSGVLGGCVCPAAPTGRGSERHNGSPLRRRKGPPRGGMTLECVPSNALFHSLGTSLVARRLCHRRRGRVWRPHHRDAGRELLRRRLRRPVHVVVG